MRADNSSVNGTAACYHCHSCSLTPVTTRRDWYSCANCGTESPRRIVLEGIKIQWLAPWIPKHYSVGAVIYNAGLILLTQRLVWPYGLALPAGHVEEGESPAQAVKRELSEELAVDTRRLRVVAHSPNLVGDQCRKGANVHDWTLFQVEVDVDQLKPSGDEYDDLVWLAPQEAIDEELTFASGAMLRIAGILPD